MKPFSIPFYLFLIFLFLATGISCDKESKDPCDDTVKPEINVGIKATVHVLTKDNEPLPTSS